MTDLTLAENLAENRAFNKDLKNIERLIHYQNKRIARGLRPITWPPTLIEPGKHYIVEDPPAQRRFLRTRLERLIRIMK